MANVNEAKVIAKAFLKKAEALKLVGYPDGGGVPTDGYGNTVGAKIGRVITEDIANRDLDNNIDHFTEELLKVLKPTTVVDLTNHELAALISFVFNCGCNSNWNIWRVVNKLNWGQITYEMSRFDHERIKGKLVEVKGLKNRRNAEIVLFNTGDIIEVEPTSSDTSNIYPKPDPAKKTQATVGVNSVLSVTAVSTAAIVGYKHFNPIVAYSILGAFGFFLVCLGIGLFLYYQRKNKPQTTITLDQAQDNLNKAMDAFIAAAKAN